MAVKFSIFGKTEDLMPTEPFGKWLERRRTDKRLTQTELSDRSVYINRHGVRKNVSQTYISDVERYAGTEKEITPRRYILKALAVGLGEPEEEVLAAAGLLPLPENAGGPHVPFNVPLRSGEIAEILKRGSKGRLNPSQIDRLAKAIEGIYPLLDNGTEGL